MKKLVLGALLLFSAQVLHAQSVHDNFNWVYGSSPSTTLTSPSFAFCDGDNVSYTVTSSVTMQHYANQISGNPVVSPGLLVPANPAGIILQHIPISFAFTQPVCNLRIHFTDLDLNESVSGFSTPYANVVETAGDLVPDAAMTTIGSNLNNSAGWAEWSGSLSSLSFTYNRPGAGYGLIIDSIVFECCTPPCRCEHRATIKNTDIVYSSGYTSATLDLNSNGVAVRSICIDLPFYQSNVDDQCLKCNVSDQEKFGTILSAMPIAGVTPELDDPYNLGYSRTICWKFTTPTVVAENVQIDLRFPEILELSCCKNSVSYCLDVTFKNDDCTSCEYQICNEFPKQNSTAKESKTTGSLPTKVWSNDFAELKSFTLSPNPTSGKVVIRLLDESLIGHQVTIMDLEGKGVYTGSVSRMEETIQLNNLTPGTYIVSIENNGQISSERLVISK
jgi:Secretion system C-terminal sorting domain